MVVKDLKIAMLGMVEGNGHPYSWSAIFNGYDPKEMKNCPYPVIFQYLEKENKDTLRIKGAKVTHIWTDDPEDAKKVAKASLIPNVAEKPEDVICEVDAVIISTDKGFEHVDRCRPFVEAKLPIFVDKPLTDNAADLKQFIKWTNEGARIMSSSCMRYCKEYMPYRISTADIGEIKYASISTPKSWERYGIHALEGVYPILKSGFISVRNTGSTDKNIVHLKHSSGADVNIIAINDMYGAFGVLNIFGSAGRIHSASSDSFYSFKAQLEAFYNYLRSGIMPFPFEETVEMMKIIIAGIWSREQNGREVFLDEILI